MPEGARSVSFPFRIAAPRETVTYEMKAQVAGSGLTTVAKLTILAADPAVRAVTEFRSSADVALDGTALTGTVVLKTPAPAGGITVSLSNNAPYAGAGVSIPLYVTIPGGSTSASFPMRVFASYPDVARPSADIGTSIAIGDIVVVPKEFALSAGGLRRGTAKGAVGIGEAPNPSGATVTLTSDTPGFTVPPTVTIPPGKPGASFPITVSDSIPYGKRVVLTATWNGRTITSDYWV
ncbi:hypothetical protein [Sphaerisporangium dianthi]|uniref:Uncharacterized protein n=1 Tax=Sphaerisporangium dianthi TaxID=1436120 RepID=A0ABV9CK28_9ACTN